MNKNFFDYGFIVMVIFSPILFTGCVSSQDEPDNINVASEEIHKIIIGASPSFTDEGDTRGPFSGVSRNATFDVGDIIGITIWEYDPSRSQHFVTENAPFVCTKVYPDGTSEWSGTAKSTSDYTNTTLYYTVYWPYNEKYSNSSCFTADDIRNKGLPDVPYDQSTPEKFKQALFCMGEGSMASGSGFLSAMLQHERTCYQFWFAGSSGRDRGEYVSDVKLTDTNITLNRFLPCPIHSGSYYYCLIVSHEGDYTMKFTVSGAGGDIPDGSYVIELPLYVKKGKRYTKNIQYSPIYG